MCRLGRLCSPTRPREGICRRTGSAAPWHLLGLLGGQIGDRLQLHSTHVPSPGPLAKFWPTVLTRPRALAPWVPWVQNFAISGASFQMGLPDLSSGFPGFPGGVSLELLIWGQGSLTKPESFPAAPRYLIGSHVGGVGWGGGVWIIILFSGGGNRGPRTSRQYCRIECEAYIVI